MRNLILLPVLGALALALSCTARANLIINGSFESGNSGFSSDYTYNSPIPYAAEFSIVQNAHEVFAPWADLNAQNGTLYFLGNGAPSTAQSPWYQTITVNPGDITTSSPEAPIYYRFQAYIASVYWADPPELAFEMSLNNGLNWQTLTTSTAPATTGQWYLTYRDGYFLTAPTTLSFRLRNSVSAIAGNDMGIDNIYFGLSAEAPGGDNPIDSIGAITGGGAVPEPGTWAAAALLLGAAGFARWRRTRAA